jgi:hypothetical protein
VEHQVAAAEITIVLVPLELQGKVTLVVTVVVIQIAQALKELAAAAELIVLGPILVASMGEMVGRQPLVTFLGLQCIMAGVAVPVVLPELLDLAEEQQLQHSKAVVGMDTQALMETAPLEHQTLAEGEVDLLVLLGVTRLAEGAVTV